MGTCLKFGSEGNNTLFNSNFSRNCIVIHINRFTIYIVFSFYSFRITVETRTRSGKTNNRFPIGKIFFFKFNFLSYKFKLPLYSFSNYHLSKLKHLIFSLTLIYHDD